MENETKKFELQKKVPICPNNGKNYSRQTPEGKICGIKYYHGCPFQGKKMSSYTNYYPCNSKSK